MGATESDGLRERKKERTRRDLMATGMRLFAERGFERVTVEDVAAEVDVSPRTFYRYFPSKEDLLLGDLSEPLDTLRASFLAQPPELPIMDAVGAALMEVTRGYDGLAAESRQRARIVDATPSLKLRQAERQTAWERVLAPLVAERLGDPPGGEPGLRADLIAACALAALRVAFTAWRNDPGHARLTDLVADALRSLGDGLAEASPHPAAV